MNPLAVALQGVGFGAALCAAQGIGLMASASLNGGQTQYGGGPGAHINLGDFLARQKKRPHDAGASAALSRRRREDQWLLLGLL